MIHLCTFVKIGFLLGFKISFNPLLIYSAYKASNVFLIFNSNIGKVCSSKEFWNLFKIFVNTKLKNIGYKSLSLSSFARIENILVE